jgi:hypothetical protein
VSRAVNLIVSCTNRKRFGGPEETAIHRIGGTSLADRLKRWKAHLRAVATSEYRAGELYMGDHWSVVRSIPVAAEQSGLKVQIWICSAGYGLIGPSNPIKPYRATFTRGEADYVASGLPDEPAVLHRWWLGVCSYRFYNQTGEPRTISALAATFPRTPIVVALSADYLTAVAPEMDGILSKGYFREHLSIVSCGTRRPDPAWATNLIPCDGSFSGALGGTLTSLNARVIRRLFQELKQRELTVEALTEVAKSIRPINIPTTVTRSSMRDSDIATFIQARLEQSPSYSKSVLLREFRNLGQACEQKRFGRIYSEVFTRSTVNA